MNIYNRKLTKYTSIGQNRRLFSPDSSVFVSANAGSGKTSLLTKRVLSLLVHGISPGRVLCLTFTNAAASEMSSRVQAELGKWVMMEDEPLEAVLSDLIGSKPGNQILSRARSLFAKVLESPEGVRIQTIHGFCQSLLKRFPVEAGVNPHFTLMDNRSEEEALLESRLRLFNTIQEGSGETLKAVHALAADSGENILQDILADIIRHKRSFYHLVTSKQDITLTCELLYRQLGCRPDDTFESLLSLHLSYDEGQLSQLRLIAAVLQKSKSDKDVEKGRRLANWLEQENKTPQAVKAYVELFIKKDGEPYKQLHTKAGLTDEALAGALQQEVQRVITFQEKLLALEVAQRTQNILLVAHSLLSLYRSLKESSARLDYDDLIIQATDLLKKPGISPWVLYKLDGGIDHVLVDEAQDTSPQQWAIIEAITQDFFSGQGSKLCDRSLFIVGDEKQSIYRFQGADVAALGRMQNFFQQKIHDSAGQAHRVGLTKSYRSVPQVLEAVDAVFSQEHIRRGIMFDDSTLNHTAHRTSHAGVVELWPLITKNEEVISAPQTRLIWQIADTIEKWLQEGTMIESRQRPIVPGDIMILVRTRTAFVERLSRALKRKNIPVAGVDRMKLNDNLAIQDMVALGQFVLLPDDDLTLACVLKSPIGNISEEELFRLAYKRGDKTLWQRLAEAEGRIEIKAYALLKELRRMVDYMAPYEFYATLLDTMGVRAHFLGRMGEEYADPIDEFLTQALHYERSHTPSLQGFLHWMLRSEAEVKRDMEQQHDAVRIMTVHGAKGLQAPVVILPDTIRLPNTNSNILWNEDPEIPLWPKNTKGYSALCHRLYEKEKQEDFAEYCRQFYVAMTRAEDQLYICGATPYKQAGVQSWYAMVQTGLKDKAQPYTTKEGEGLRLGVVPSVGRKQVVQEKDNMYPENLHSFEFLTQPVPVEPNPSRPLAPSHMPDDEPAAASPLNKKHSYSRGLLIHKLLQYLPEYEPKQRHGVANKIAENFDKQMEAHQKQQCIKEALSVIDHEEFKFLFSPQGLSEVPVTGTVTLKNKPYTVSGQIDRLYLGDEIWIVDYKTGRQPPRNGENTPLPYLRQLALYRLLLADIYPKKTIHCGLLWTAEAKINVIPSALLDAAL